MKKITKAAAVTALVAGGVLLGAAAPAQAWYVGGFNSYSSCVYALQDRDAAGGVEITSWCNYRPYDGKWAYTFEYTRNHG